MNESGIAGRGAFQIRLYKGKWRAPRIPQAKQAHLARWLLAIQGGRCAYCGCQYPKLPCVDHVIPASRGGSDEIDNLIGACRPCNSAKRNSTPLHYLIRMQAKYGVQWTFGWANAYTGSRPEYPDTLSLTVAA